VPRTLTHSGSEKGAKPHLEEMVLGLTRRAVSLAPLLFAAPPSMPPLAPAGATLEIPLRPCDVGALCAIVDLGRGVRVKAVVDTGSPHLTVPADGGCNERDGCADALAPAPGAPTSAIFGVGGVGVMRWRHADRFIVAGVDLARAHDKSSPPPGVTVGVPDLLLRRASGGFFLGLIAASDDADRRPLLSQLELPRGDAADAPSGGLQIAAFRIDAPRRVLTFSSAPLISSAVDALQLVDLRPFGATVRHYAVRVSALEIDGVRLPLARMKRPVVCIFDSGLSCAVISSGLIADAARAARGMRGARALDRPPDEWSSLALTMRTEQSAAVALSAGSDGGPFFCAAVQEGGMYPEAARSPAPGDERPHFVAVGATFVGGGVLTIDVFAGRASFEPGALHGNGAWYA